MPRVTRGQLRAQEAKGGPQFIHEDNEAMITTAGAQDYDPFSTETSNRPPLGEIQNSNNPPPLQPDLGEQLTPTNQSKGPRKSTTSNKQNLKLILTNGENFSPSPDQQVLEDENQSDASSAAEVAAEELRRDSPASEILQAPVDKARPMTPPSTAAQEASRSLSKSPEKRLVAVQGPVQGTPRFDPVLHAETSSTGQVLGQRSEDSFVESIKTRTPARIMTSEQPTGDDPDSFVEDIISQSPSKYVARIEDSVEAIDALEEAIEQVAEELPKAMSKNLESPVKNKTPQAKTARKGPVQGVTHPMAPLEQSSKPTKGNFISKTPSNTGRKPPPRVSSARPQPRTSTLTTVKSRSSTQPTVSAAMTKPSPPTPMTTKTPRRTTNTNLSTSKPGFVPVKSAKPPTKSNFTLPGDAISAKMKAQREERLKEEEAKAEEARKRTGFKARPVPKSVSSTGAGGKARVSSVLPRENAASRARMSLMIAKKDENGKENAGPAVRKVVSGTGIGSARAGAVARKSVIPPTAQSGLSVTKTRTRPSVTVAATTTGRVSKSTVPANSSAVRRNTTSQTAPAKTRQSSIQTTSSSGVQSGSEGSSNTKSATTARTGKMAKGKEVFSRAKLAEEELQKQKREKEAAAKKARAEAAERGRLASREWAEKQRVRKLKKETVAVPGKVEGLKIVGLDEAEGQEGAVNADGLMGAGEVVQ